LPGNLKGRLWLEGCRLVSPECAATGKTKDIPSDAQFEQSGASVKAPPKGPIGSAPDQVCALQVAHLSSAVCSAVM